MIPSRFHRSLIQCPKCLNDIDAVIWDVIDADSDPDLKERLLLKKIQQQVCLNCGNDFVLAEPLLYCDPQHKLLIAYIPEAVLGNNPTGSAETADPLTVLDPALLPDWHCRRFSDYNKLIETIHVYDHFCDDRLMEIVKVAIQTQGCLEPPAVDIHFLTADDAMMRFLAQADSGEWFTVDYPSEIYINTETMFQEKLPPETGWLSPDTTFAADLIRQQTALLEQNAKAAAGGQQKLKE
ncbi:MAG: hypothetical protein GX749_00180 [Ruminococcaceae bacterium]|nr:hypothetical protein [Oscillospiraceae bacterium]